MRMLSPSQFRLNRIYSMKNHNHNQHHREHNIHQICRWRKNQRKRREEMRRKKKMGPKNNNFRCDYVQFYICSGCINWRRKKKINPTNLVNECDREKEREHKQTEKKNHNISDRLKWIYERLDESGLRQKAWPHLIANARDTYLNGTHVEKYTQVNIFRRRWQRCCCSFPIPSFSSSSATAAAAAAATSRTCLIV